MKRYPPMVNNDFLTFEVQDLSQALEALAEIGYRLAHPEVGEISGFDNSGDRVVFESEEQAISALNTGSSGIQVWRSPGDDYFLSLEGARLFLNLDGHSKLERKLLYGALSKRGVEFEEEWG